ncbi:hypothetical protein WG908_15900 [Sphingobium sp. AN641]|uniref:hypothetical protein n=1 Tax=Sphingobium sp. AN641 TaxID=3133443 RepID=UPI0030BA998F
MKVFDPAWVAFEDANPILVPNGLYDPHPAIAVAADVLQQRARLPADIYGAVHCWAPNTFHIRVHPSSIDRALRILDAFAKACLTRSFQLRPADRHLPDSGLCVCIDGHVYPITLNERMARRRYKPTKQEQSKLERGRLVIAPTYTYHPSGQLSLLVGHRRKWADRPRHPLEGQLNAIMLDLRTSSAAETEKQIANEEAEKRVQALLRQREALRARVEHERLAVAALHDEAAAWQQAQTIRAYIAAVEAQPIMTDRNSWALWAHAQADRLDPLCTSPSSLLDTPGTDYRDLDADEWLNEDGDIEHI